MGILDRNEFLVLICVLEQVISMSEWVSPLDSFAAKALNRATNFINKFSKNQNKWKGTSLLDWVFEVLTVPMIVWCGGESNQNT